MQDIKRYRAELIQWYELNARDLPWRRTQDPYKIWLSEIILQQTRVQQGLPYYERFVAQYPTVDKLAAASEDEVLGLWKGLGYYSRARNLHHTAKSIVNDWNGQFPKAYKDILSLKGVGKYTAAAIASFAYDSVQAVVDGNVIRVLSRQYGILDAVDDTKVIKRIWQIADECIDPDKPAAYNQAIMELGAMVCTPKSTNCTECPVSTDCTAYREDQVALIPYKAKKIKRKARYFHYLYIANAQGLLLGRRDQKDIWQGLYQLPLIETQDDRPLEAKFIEENTGLKGIQIKELSDVRLQKLTHRDIHARFYHIDMDASPDIAIDGYFLADQKKVSTFALPKVIDAYLSEYQANSH